ncbi:RICIN domain-containing protein [Streptomyces sp. NPDC020742]|uniref:RICIN domain-containing protein n=1 Tax=Streptomyces sp. NPDC020742 TaxID=3154897 RepID=UPI0033F8B863
MNARAGRAGRSALGSIALLMAVGVAVPNAMESDAAAATPRAADHVGGLGFRHVAGQADNVYYIVNGHSGKCLTVKGASTADYAPVNQYRCVGAKNQWWVIYNLGGLWRRIENYHSQKALSLGGGSDRKGTVAVQESYQDGTSQLWYSQLPNAQHWAGQLQPVNGHDKCLEVQGASTADNAPVINWPCNHRTNQDWKAKG